MDKMKIEEKIIIIGGGFSGIGAAIKLKKSGINNFIILETSEGLGGTWRHNQYPGLCCDIMAHLYSFSFAPNKEWTSKYPTQSEILKYLNKIADENDIRSHITFNCSVESCEYDDVHSQWLIKNTKNTSYRCKYLIFGVGQLNRPKFLDITGKNDFKGTLFHSAQWRHDFDLKNKSVAIIGNGPTGAQIIPAIVDDVKKLYVFQRTATWIYPRNDKQYGRLSKIALKNIPFAQKLYRWSIFLSYEKFYPALLTKTKLSKLLSHKLKKRIRTVVKDKKTARKLTPYYPPLAKRIVFADNYLPVFNSNKLKLITTQIDHMTKEGIKSANKDYLVDAVIEATGFRSTEFLSPILINGKRGKDLNTAWSQGAHAYLGMLIPDFPNLFLLYGPNTNLGHSSIVFMIECQINYILKCINKVEKGKYKSIAIKTNSNHSYNKKIQASMKDRVWSSNIHSWYKTEEGKIVNNWPYSSLAYWWSTRAPRFENFYLE